MAASTTDMEIAFGPYRLDKANARLMREHRPVPLTPKALDLLHYLASRPGRLVTKDELLAALWPDVLVSDASIKVCIREIRKALDDGAKTPTYIETVHRRGYRFIAEARESMSTLPQDLADPLVRGLHAVARLGGFPAPADSFGLSHPFSPQNVDIQPLRHPKEGVDPERRQCVFICADAKGVQILFF